MGLSKKNTQSCIGMAIFLYIVIHLYSIAIPMVYAQNTDYLFDKERTPNSKNSPFLNYGKILFFKELSETEALTNLEIKLISDRRLSDLIKFINRLDVVITQSCIGMGILLMILLSVIPMPLCKSVLALSIGGHAPPAGSIS